MARGNAMPRVLEAKLHVPTPEVRIRPACPEDRAWLIPLSARLHEFGAAWRSPDSIDQAVALPLERALANPSSNSVILVAEDAYREPLGFIHLHTDTDFTGEIHSHVSDLVVHSTAEGLGVGTALLRAAESWARGRQHRLLTLNVFTANHRARELYERMGFSPDRIRLVKELGLAAGPKA